MKSMQGWFLTLTLGVLVVAMVAGPALAQERGRDRGDDREQWQELRERWQAGEIGEDEMAEIRQQMRERMRERRGDGPTGAQAERPAGLGGPAGPGAAAAQEGTISFQLGQVMRLLGLEREQQREILMAMREHGPALGETAERLSAERDRLMQLLYVETGTERQIRAQAQRFASAISDHAVAHRAMAAEVSHLLTDEQLETVSQWYSGAEARESLIRERAAERGARPGMRRGGEAGPQGAGFERGERRERGERGGGRWGGRERDRDERGDRGERRDRRR